MKKLLILLSIITLVSCEEVINVDLTTSEPKLVIDASINWAKGTSGNVQTIKLSTTTGYYQREIPKVSGATVYITNSSNVTFNFIEETIPVNNTGKYTCSNFIPLIGETYLLTVIYNGETYTAEEKLLQAPDITNIEQQNDLGLNNDQIGLKTNFNDISNQDNFYLLRYETNVTPFPEYQILGDKFNQNSNMVGLYTNEKLIAGSEFSCSLYGITKRYYNYMTLLIGASSGGNSGPFQVPPTKVRGNITNITNPNSNPLGYFRLSETVSLNYTVQ
ncbi:DUF4249 domain-containing protein [Flavobacterium sp. FlaQc-28]|uniref:DUF4249 domain-containing protein n=1 Tax=Flavobacterium sp. FlaQc-28 TaxID=3374178 RepID=UPI0037565F0B